MSRCTFVDLRLLVLGRMHLCSHTPAILPTRGHDLLLRHHRTFDHSGVGSEIYGFPYWGGVHVSLEWASFWPLLGSRRFFLPDSLDVSTELAITYHLLDGVPQLDTLIC